MRDMLGELRRCWRLDPVMTALCAALLVSQVGAFSVIGLAMRAVVDHAGHADATGLLVAALIGGAGFALGGIGVYVQFELRSDLADRIGYLQLDPEIQRLTAELDGLEHIERAEYVDRLAMLRGKGQEIAAAAWVVPETAVLVAQLGVTLLLLGAVDPLLLLLVVFTVPAVLLNTRAYRGIGAAALSAAETARVERHLHDLTTRPAAGKEIRVSGIAARLMGLADMSWRRVTAIEAPAQVRAAGLAAAASTLFVLGYAGGLTYVVSLVAHHERSVGDLVLVIVLAARLRDDFQWLQYNLGNLRRGLVLMAPYRWLLDYAAAARRTPAETAPPQQLRDGIQLRDITFAYAGGDETVLGPLSVDLPAGAMVALVGEYGSGKSTLVKLLCKFYQPGTGTITVDGADLAGIDTTAWRAATSAAFQDFARYEVTTRHAIGLGDLPALDDEARVRAAVRAADAGPVVDALPAGLDTQLGLRFDGVDLSEGQWQKVALGRACMRQAPILVLLDEPTAALDAPSEQAIFERHAAIARHLGQTYGTITLIVSHRFSTIRMADLILVLADGKLVEHGTHRALVAAGGTYAELHKLQQQAYAG